MQPKSQLVHELQQLIERAQAGDDFSVMISIMDGPVTQIRCPDCGQPRSVELVGEGRICLVCRSSSHPRGGKRSCFLFKTGA